VNFHVRPDLQGARVERQTAFDLRWRRIAQRRQEATLAGGRQNIRGFFADNDPYGEHDFGAVEIGGERFLFKIDYYDRSLTAHSPDKADPAATTCVLTIMRADEY
jgi:hypothetical protein